MLFLRFPNPEKELITNFYNKKPKDNYFLFHYHYESYSPNKTNQLPQDYLVQQSCFLCWCLFLKALFFLLRTASENFWCSMPLYEGPRRSYFQVLEPGSNSESLGIRYLACFPLATRASVNNLAHLYQLHYFVAWNSLCSLYCLLKIREFH